MIISWYNLLDDAATLTATNESLNNPVENLIHFFLEKAFVATSISTVITATWTTEQIMDHVAYGYHNIDAMNIKFYDEFDVLVDNIDVTIEEDETIYYFDAPVEDVYKVVITITNAIENVSIGSISLGEFYELPGVLRGAPYPLSIRGEQFKTPGGQVGGNRHTNLKGTEITLRRVDNDDKVFIENILDYIGNVKPVYFDLFPDDRTSYPVFYGNITSSDLPTRKRTEAFFYWELSFTCEEAR